MASYNKVGEPEAVPINKNTSKLDQIQVELDKTTDVLRKDIQIALANAQTADEVSNKAQNMKAQAQVFRKTAGDVKCHFCLQYYKMIMLLLFILAVIGVVIWLIVTGGKSNN